MFIYNIFAASYELYFEMAPYLFIGLIFVGLMNFFITKEIIYRHVGGNNILSVFKAALFGAPLPLCSCGVISTSVFMSKSGASKGSVISFLISTPQTGIDSMVATYGMMGWIFAIYRPIVALIMGILGGITVFLFDGRKKEIQNGKTTIKKIEFPIYHELKQDKKSNLKSRIKDTLHYSFVEFLDDISLQFVVGLLISGLISIMIPADYFDKSVFQSGLLGMAMIAILAAPMYVCATASIPVALTLLMKGFSPGVAFAFLVTGPATNAASLTILSKTLGKKTTAIYLIFTILFAIIFGYLLDAIFTFFNLKPNDYLNHTGMSDSHGAEGSDIVSITIGIIFLCMLAFSFYRKYFKKHKVIIMNNQKTELKIEGMTCNHCVMNVQKGIAAVKGVTAVDVILSDNKAIISGDFSLEAVASAVDELGYKAILN